MQLVVSFKGIPGFVPFHIPYLSHQQSTSPPRKPSRIGPELKFVTILWPTFLASMEVKPAGRGGGWKNPGDLLSFIFPAEKAPVGTGGPSFLLAVDLKFIVLVWPRTPCLGRPLGKDHGRAWICCWPFLLHFQRCKS